MVARQPYANRYREVEIRTANPLQLVVILYDGAIQNLQEAVEKLRRGDIEGRSHATNRALAILSELQASLNFKEGGQISTALDSLYAYMKRQIFAASVEKSLEPFQEVASLLMTLRTAWQELAAQAHGPAATPGPDPAAGGGLLKTGTTDSVEPALLNLSC